MQEKELLCSRDVRSLNDHILNEQILLVDESYHSAFIIF